MKLAILLVLCTFVIVGLPMYAQVPGSIIPDQRAVDVMPANPQYAALIIYNPANCPQTNFVCGLFVTPVHRHIINRHYFMPQNGQSVIAGSYTDCWAATNIDSHETLDTYQSIMPQGGYSNWKIAGNLQHQAGRAGACVVRTGKWKGL